MKTLVPEHTWQHKGVTLGVMLATIMQTVDSTIANVALPHMQGSLGASRDQIAWVLTSYIVSAAITIPLVGWLSGYVGRKLVFQFSIVGFTVASVLCGLADSMSQMILFRILQGISGAAFLPLSQAVLFDINSPKNFGKAMAIWGVGVMVGPIIGPTLGGWLTENYTWSWCFYINVPIGILAYLCLFVLLPESPTQEKKFDFFGFAALSLTLAFLQLILDRGQLKDWFGSHEIVIYTIGLGLFFYMFLVHSFTHPNPYLNPRLFKDRNYVVSNILIFAIGIVLYATLALVPSMIQHLLNYPVDMAGMLVAPRGIGAMLGMILVGKLILYIDSRYLMTAGLLMTAYSLHMMTQFTLIMDSYYIVTSGILQGVGLGLAYVPLTTFGFATLPPELRNEGAAFFNLMRNIGSSVGISVVETLLTRNMQTMHSSLSTHIVPYNAAHQIGYSANHIDPTTPVGQAMLNELMTQQSAMIGYLNDYKFMMVVTLAVLPLVILMKAPKKGQEPTEPMVME